MLLKIVNNKIVLGDRPNVVTVTNLNLSARLLHLEANILPDLYPELYRRGVYLQNVEDPLILFDVIYWNINKERVFFTNKNDIDDYFNEEKHLFIADPLSTEVMNSKEWKRLSSRIKDYSTFKHITVKFVELVSVIYMCEHNNENLAVKKDVLDISNHVELFPCSENIKTFDDIAKKLQIEHDELFAELSVLYQDILDTAMSRNPLSLNINVFNSTLTLEFYSSPSSLRYKVNVSVRKMGYVTEERDSGYDDIVPEDKI